MDDDPRRSSLPLSSPDPDDGEDPLEHLAGLSDRLGIDLWIKRDDLTGIGFGGTETRQPEFHMGAARAEGCKP